MVAYNQISNTIWNIANHLRGSWKAYEYQDVILPLTVLKRLDVALEPTKQKTLTRFNVKDIFVKFDFEKEVKPYAPDAWVDESMHDEKDGKIGKVGYEAPRAVGEIEKEIERLENESSDLLRGLVTYKNKLFVDKLGAVR